MTSKSSASTAAESGGSRLPNPIAQAQRLHQLCTQDAPSLYTGLGFMRRFRSSALGRSEANHAGRSRLRANGKSAVMKGCRYPFRIQAQLAVHAHPELPAVAVPFMQQIMDIHMVAGVFE